MKIAFVFPPMWTPHSEGSLQIWNQEVTTRLARHSDVLVYSGLFSFRSQDYVDGVNYRRFSTRWDSRFIRRFDYIHKALKHQGPLFYSDLWYPFYLIKVALDLRKQGCDVAHVYYYPQYATLIKYLNPKLKVILHMHGEWLTQVKYTNLRARLRKIDRIVSCADFVTASIRATFPEIADRCKTIFMGLSPEAFSREDQHHPDADKRSPRRLLCVGRISPEKGVHVLLDAFELIVRKYPDASLTIVGPEWVAPREDITDLCLSKEAIASLTPYYQGSYLSQLKQKLSPEAAKRVTFAGLVAHNDVPIHYLNADIYISPSLYESFGVSVIEAMVAGVPVVAGRVKAFEELITDGHNGLLVEAANPSAIADAVMNLFSNPQLWNSISRNAREQVRARFSWETICSTLMQTYQEVLGSKEATPDDTECVEVESNASRA
jgi:glycosyltransferase involved in cell wall biosynthesis